MKKILALLIAAAFLSVGCTDVDTTDDTQETVETENDNTETNADTDEATVAYETSEPRLGVWDRSGTIWVDVSMEITNTGTTNLYLSDGAFDVEDSSGGLLETYDMVSIVPNVIEPGETAYLYGCTTANNITDVNDSYVAVPSFEAAEATIDRVRFPVTDVTMTDADYGTYIDIIGRVENTSDEDESMVNIYFVFFDTAGEVICIKSTYTDAKAGGKSSFDTSTMTEARDVTTSQIGSYEVYAYPLDFQLNFSF